MTDLTVDFGNALDAEATPGVSEGALERLDERVARAHDTITTGMAEGEFGYASLNLPERTDAAAIESAVADIDADHVLTVGIGGSALGAVTVSAALGLADRHHTLDNVDPEETRRLLDSLPLERTAVNVVSRSGTTAETLANFLVVREALDEAGVDWTDRTVVTTGESGPLREAAEAEGLPALDVPDGVPGRFSALSAVGLVPAAILGGDIGSVLDGGTAGREALLDGGSLFDYPGYTYGAVAYALEQRGATVNAMLPYAESLESFAEWFAQLWAESLGKDGLGQTPARALGATDQHSQLQLYRSGRHDKLVTLVRPRERDDVDIPATDVEGMSYLGDATLGELLDAEFEATEASLAAADQPNVRVELPRVDAAGIGRLLFDIEAACVLAGELMGVETFTQPAVEWGKRAARGLLGGGEFAEADAVAEKTTRVVGGE
ncbi:glucose-6-phosphate isomerase [Haloglomus litoreum]|uniref:glucose-6-phosphate isomerase n=1 Tax=Haloglomus litoreum TaxID=3034026 RepID=UPI0023E8823A|nr:glucose-6-phosphate isomerase [Haloglomus sp. DT116]